MSRDGGVGDSTRRILSLMTRGEKRRGLMVLLLVVATALVETAGVASVMPFLAVLGNPAVIETNHYLRLAFGALNFENVQSFLLLLGIVSFLVIVLGSILRLGTHYALQRWANLRRHSISYRLLEGYLNRPYEFFLGRNTADLSKSLLSEVDEVTANILKPAINLVAFSTSALVLTLFLVLLDPLIALAVAGLVGGTYLVTYLGVRKVLSRVGVDRADSNRERFTTAGEVLGGIKEVKVLGKEAAYLERFRGPSLRYSKHQATNSVLSVVPKYVIEAVGFGGILALAVALMLMEEDLSSVLPLLGVYAVAGYRLLPAAQNVFAALSHLRFGWAAIEVIERDLKVEDTIVSKGNEATRTGNLASPFDGLRREIRVEDVSYKYPGASCNALSGVNFVLPVNASLGIVGATGAGKTTLVDILLSLLEPSEGTVCIDETPLERIGLKVWRDYVGYVPQDIYLVDASIAENVAMGVSRNAVDIDLVREASKTAMIHDHIKSLPDMYDTQVGERGVRLSGGQRQRLGIARALYRRPQLLVMDEGTSALDGETEAELWNAVSELMGSVTLVVIAHRIHTVRNCDQILVLSDGRSSGLGTYHELIESSAHFRRLAGVG